MNDLQLSLLGIGALVIAGVVAYNWWQERRFRKLAQARFQSQRDDVLFGTTLGGQPPEARPEARIEPTVSIEPEVEEKTAAVHSDVAVGPATARVAGAAGPTEWPAAVDAQIHCVAQLILAEPMPAVTVREALAEASAADKPVAWFGRVATGEWLDVSTARDSAEFSVVIGALQLADRAGPLSAEALDRFLVQAQEVATRLMAVAELPERAETLARAAALDQFCADVDVLVGVNVVAMGQGSFAGTKLRALAEAAGLRLATDGTFQYRDDQGNVLYALANQEAAPFEAEAMRNLSTHGVTLLFDVPRVSNGLRVFDQMMLFAHQLADSLKGTLVDDNLRPLSDEGVARIRQQLSALYAKMDARGIRAGSPQALRLFS